MLSKVISFFILMAMSAMSWAGCTGSSTYYTCSDDSGNTYSVNKIGNYTMTQGHNYNTGASWNSTSNTIGNTTYQNGRAANGNSWNQTITDYGSSTHYSGTDSNGNYFSTYKSNY